MASIEIPISDDKILDYLAKERGLALAPSRDLEVVSVEVEQEAPSSNSKVSHTVTVQIRYGLELGEIERLVEF